MGNGAWAEGRLPAVSLQIEKVMGECPAMGSKGLREVDTDAEEDLSWRGVAQPQGLQEQGGFPSDVPCHAGAPGTIQEHMGLMGQGGSLHLSKAGTDTRRWPCQSWRDIPTGRLAKHHTQLAGAGGVRGRCLLPHGAVLVPAISPGTGPPPSPAESPGEGGGKAAAAPGTGSSVRVNMLGQSTGQMA